MTPFKNVPVRWRAYSLAMKNDNGEATTAQGALRVVEAVWAKEGDEPIGRLYTEIGTRFIVQGDISPGAVSDALAAAGLDLSYAAAAADDRWDDEIRGSMAEAIDLVGAEVGVPILVFRDGDATAAIFGPVVSPAPRGDEALALWDQVVTLAWSPSFYELKRSRTGPPQVQVR